MVKTNTMTITHDQVGEDSIHKFSAFASELGLKVGEFPAKLETSMGNGRPFLAVGKKVVDGDLQYVQYRQEAGCIELKIFND